MRQRLAHIMISDQHSDPALLELHDDLLHLTHTDWVDPTKGLIHQQKLRSRHQRSRNL